MSLEYMFRRLVFTQVLLGIVAFCMAEKNPGMMLVAGSLGLLSWYVSEGPRGKPLPQWIINLGATAAVLWLVVDITVREHRHVIIAMGHFTMWLQVMQLYGKKSNREYGLVLVLSLLQMVGASILSVSMIFGVLLVIYCVLSLFTVLLFQFKATSDEIRLANQAGAPEGVMAAAPKVVTGPGHRWQFRFTAIFIALVCGLSAVVAFVLIPRTSRFDDRQLSVLSNPQVGFSDRVALAGPAPTGGSNEVVLNMEVSGDGRRQPFYLLRGAALDEYSRRTQTWSRGVAVKSLDEITPLNDAGHTLAHADVPLLDVDITLRSSRHRAVFTLYPTTRINSSSLHELVVNPLDQQMAMETTPGGVIGYRFQAAVGAIVKPERPPAAWPGPYRFRRGSMMRYARGWDADPQAVRDFALRILREHYDDPALNRVPFIAHDTRDYEFARVLEKYLQTRFSYALTNHMPGPRDPTVTFLLSEQRGHCELFAAGLAAMCRSLGMRARVVTGYRVSEFNNIGGYFIVRQRHAHAWTEIDCGEMGWQTFDATPPGDVNAEHAADDSWLAGARQFYEHMEFLWIDAFVAYDKETRDEVLSGIKESFRRATDDDTWLGAVISFFKSLGRRWQFDRVNLTIAAISLFFIAIGVVSLARMFIVRRRRLAALQLDRLDSTGRRQLARRLGFYLTLLDQLERHGHARPPHHTPRQFADHLVTHAGPAFEPVRGLTDLFYEIRFGHRPLDETRRQRVRELMRKLESVIGVGKGRSRTTE